MSDDHTKTDVERSENERDRQDGKAPVKQGGTPSPTGQDEPRIEDVSKQTV